MLTVAGIDVPDLRITVGPGTSVSGRIVFDGPAPASAAMSSVRVQMANAGGFTVPGVQAASRATSIDTDGRFGFAGLSGRVIVEMTPLEGWMMKSVVVGGRDITNSVLDVGNRESVTNVVITLTNKVTSVEGRVTDERGQSVRDYAVVIVPAEPYDAAIATRRIRAIRPGAEGTFTTRGLMPGRYLALAVEALEEGRQYAPEFQQQVRRRGQEFTLGEGESSTLNLRLQPDL
jgi:hypothetical protein